MREGRIGFFVRGLLIKFYKSVRLFLTGLREGKGIMDEVLFDISLLGVRDDEFLLQR